jgi:protein-tyrosine phosphatase
MVKVLFVCLGNICRSPMAEGLMAKHVQESGLAARVSVDSAGTSNWHVGELPDPRMIETAQRHAVTLPSRARQLVLADLDAFDYIVAMDQQNMAEIQRLQQKAIASKARLLMMRDFDVDGLGMDVPDPYFGGLQGFEQVYLMLERSTKNLLQHIRKEQQLG